MKQLSAFLVIIVFCVSSYAQNKSVEGMWMGALDVGVQLRIVLNVMKDSSGNYTSTMDSPDQGVRRIPTTSTVLSTDSLIVIVESIKGKYEGLQISDSIITGTWSQGSAKLPLTMKRVTEVAEVKRPQTPKPPFNYKVEEVAIDNANKTVHLAGTFTRPSSGGPFTTLILITGSGTQDRDETIAGHKPFAVIADHLTKQGYAVLRLDDRGAGKSTAANITNSTSKDFADDINLAVNYLQSRADVNKKKIGLVGHSEGGLIAALVASKRTDINFMILLAGPGTKGSVLLADQNVAIFKRAGISAKSANAYRSLYLQLSNAVITSADSAAAFNMAWNAYQAWKKTTPEELREELRMTYDDESASLIKSLLEQFSNPWMKYFLNSDPSPLLQKTTAKVLALNGGMDLQVLPKQNLAGIKAALQKSKSPLYGIKELPGLNHLFQGCKDCTINEYSLLEETFSPVALKEITNWLNTNIK
jgi:uncharacterized protein